MQLFYASVEHSVPAEECHSTFIQCVLVYTYVPRVLYYNKASKQLLLNTVCMHHVFASRLRLHSINSKSQ